MSEKVVGWVKDAIIELGKWVLTGIIDNSYWVCLVICMGALVLYVAGHKKSGKWMPISLVIYYFLQSIGLLFK